MNRKLERQKVQQQVQDDDLYEKLERFIIDRLEDKKDYTDISWKKLGNIFDDHHAQLPVVDVLEDKIRVYYSTRKDGKSLPMFFDVSSEDVTSVMSRSPEPLLNLGKPGSFDWSGVMPTCIVNHKGVKYMYYIGWSQRIDVPYHNTLGLAISEDGETWKKYSEGPVFGTSTKEPGYIGTAEVLIENGVWRMWYLSCRDWVEHDGRMEPLYDIKYAESLDGVSWDPKNITAIHLLEGEGGVSAARVIKTVSGYEMFFSVRKEKDYRSKKSCSYRILKATSKDGMTWKREDRIEIAPSHLRWENFMTCYPAIARVKDETYMFYNGNDFGKTGIGCAIKVHK